MVSISGAVCVVTFSLHSSSIRLTHTVRSRSVEDPDASCQRLSWANSIVASAGMSDRSNWMSALSSLSLNISSPTRKTGALGFGVSALVF